MSFATDLAKLWIDASEKLSNNIINKYNNGQYDTNGVPIKLDDVKMNKIKDETFFVIYQIIDRELFLIMGQDKKENIITDVLDIVLVQHLLKTNNKDNLTNFLKEVDDHQVLYGDMRDLATKEGPGGVLYEFGHIIAEIALNQRYTHSVMQVYGDSMSFWYDIKMRMLLIHHHYGGQ